MPDHTPGQGEFDRDAFQQRSEAGRSTAKRRLAQTNAVVPHCQSRAAAPSR